MEVLGRCAGCGSKRTVNASSAPPFAGAFWFEEPLIARLMAEQPRFPFHFESRASVRAPADTLFSHLDDPKRLSSHMGRSSWMMMGSRMDIQLDESQGRAVGSRIRLQGRVLGIRLSVDETVTERTPPFRKVWETTRTPKLLVIGPYRMGYEITPRSGASMLRVFIDYSLPDKPPTRWLGRLFGGAYARWCTRRMVEDAARHFRQGRQKEG